MLHTLAVFLLTFATAAAFAPVRSSPRRPSALPATPQEMLAGAEFLEIELFPHKPMGCTAEESLAQEELVFISKIVEGGPAEAAGLQVGDVICSLTGLFGEMEAAYGIDKV